MPRWQAVKKEILAAGAAGSKRRPMSRPAEPAAGFGNASGGGASHLFDRASSGGPPIVSSTIAPTARTFGNVSRRSGGVTIVVTSTMMTEAEKTSRQMIWWVSP